MFYCFVIQLVMSSLQSVLENLDTPELLCQSVKCILLVARCYPHIFSTNFRVSSTSSLKFKIWKSERKELVNELLLLFFRTQWIS